MTNTHSKRKARRANAGQSQNQSIRRTFYNTPKNEIEVAHLLRSILRRSIEALLPSDALKVSRVAEESERARLIDMAIEIGGAQ